MSVARRSSSCLPLAVWTLLQLAAALLALLAVSLTAIAAGEMPASGGALRADTVHVVFGIHYLSAPGEDPVLVAREQARLEARRLKLVHHLHAPPSEPVMSAALARDLATPGLPAALQRSQRVLKLEFTHPRTRASDALRVATRLVEQVARDTGGMIWDEATREAFTPDEWQRARADAWADEHIDVARQVALQIERSGELVDLSTRGMSKLGLPELGVDHVPVAASRAMSDLLFAVAQALAEGATPGPAGAFDLDLRGLRQPDANARQKAAQKQGAGGPVKLTLAALDPQRLELQFDRQPGTDAAARLMASLNAAYGSPGARSPAAVPAPAGDPPSVEDVARASMGRPAVAAAAIAPTSALSMQTRLAALRDAFTAGLPARETIQLKAPFPLAEGGVEWLWVEVLGWRGDAIVGVLRSPPRSSAGAAGLAVGQIVNLRQRDVTDYLHRRADGSQDGNASAQRAR